MNKQAKKVLEFSILFSVLMVLLFAGLAVADIASFAGSLLAEKKEIIFQ